MAILTFDAGSKTEDLTLFILDNLPDDLAGEIVVRRENERSSGLSSEPVTIATVLALTTVIAPHVARIIELWMHQQNLETQRTEETRRLAMVLEGFDLSTEAGKTLAALAEKYAEVTVSSNDGLFRKPG